MKKFETAVIGAGPTGLVAALALARMGVDVALVGPPAASAAADQRTTALVGPSIELLRNVGVWGEGPKAGNPRRRPVPERAERVGQPTADPRPPTAVGS